ncbi:hypothetical protein HPB50_012909 [Hyalomma asiaticum]|uniref:Uncharacterized protein n=1 Tax=Hyalomma asiaticum TaxID=266040 RepID=A0ACB7SXT4_HYAAI|nr:hypothetical protein HPB50_012909 [Hyalomma asiaticum]
MEVCGEEKAEEADAKCRQGEIEAKMEKMMAIQSGLMDRIAELENALAREREKTQAMGERLRLAEEELAMVVKRYHKMIAFPDGRMTKSQKPRQLRVKEVPSSSPLVGPKALSSGAKPARHTNCSLQPVPSAQTRQWTLPAVTWPME